MEKYITIEKRSSFEFEDRKSVFIGQACPVTTEEEAISFINETRKSYPDARHHVYAYILKNNAIMRFSDDGEPQGTAGKPVLETIRKNECVDIVIVVTRYFGGTLLGTGGLVRAYTASALGALESAHVIEYKPYTQLRLKINYSDYNKISSVISSIGFKIEDSDFADDINIIGSLPTEMFDIFEKKLIEITAGRVVIKKLSEKFDF